MKNIINTLFIFFFINTASYSNENLNNKILKNLRCLVCQGQTVQDSNSEFALIIKSVVKDKIKEGNNEKEIYNFLSEKYGDWILLNPPFNKNSYLLWLFPYLLFVLGVIFLFLLLKKTKIRPEE
jgi:cytochrome c-type biogenesis protein CcmH